jgi:signal transduction histidine kinase
MKNKKYMNGIVLICDEKGLIENIIRNDFDLPVQGFINKPVTKLFEKRDVSKVMDFLMHVKKYNIAFDYSLSLALNDETVPLYFTGFFLEQKVWMVGAGSTSDTLKFINQLQQINNEQANFIRSLVKKNYNIEQNERTSSDQLNDLSRLNNELVNLQREMAKKNAELERLNELKNQFLGMAAHDLRNPLGIIMSFAEFLEDETKDTLSAEHRKFLHIINTSAEFLLKMIEDLLDISKIESGKLSLNRELTDLIELAEKNITLNNALSAKKDISIQLNYNKKPLILNIDPQKMEQVLNNLLTNAVKFSHPGSTVYLTVTDKTKSVQVEVRDEGVGIPPDKTETVFQPFGKASSTGTAGEKSTGLGLFIVKNIIEGHHGTIAVESEPEKGSRFYFELPR